MTIFINLEPHYKQFTQNLYITFLPVEISPVSFSQKEMIKKNINCRILISSLLKIWNMDSVSYLTFVSYYQNDEHYVKIKSLSHQQLK